MTIQIIRHGAATHLLQDYSKKITSSDFVQMLKSWESATLTDEGVDQIKSKVEEIRGSFVFLYHSPLIRVRQSADLFNDRFKNLLVIEEPALTEIMTTPLWLPKNFKLSIKSWIALCIIKSCLNLSVAKYIKEAGKIINKVGLSGENTLLVSHQARILTILIYCLISPKWKILKVDVNPAGISIVGKR